MLDDLAILAAQAAVQRTITLFAQETGRGLGTPEQDPHLDRCAALFLPDATWEIPHLGIKFEGRAAIREALVALSADFAFVLQHNAPALVELDGGVGAGDGGPQRAHARSAIREVGRFRDRDEAFEFLGIYDDTLAQMPEGWRFERRVFQGVGTVTWGLHNHQE